MFMSEEEESSHIYTKETETERQRDKSTERQVVYYKDFLIRKFDSN